MSMMESRRWARASGSSSERLKIALKVWRLATLKKHRAEMDMCRSIGSMWGRNTPLATPRSYTACTALMAGTFSSWMVAERRMNSPRCMFSFITRRMKSGLSSW